jgi:hypothetical protein
LPYDEKDQADVTDKKIIVVAGATGAQGGGLARAILDDPQGPFAVRALTRNPDAPKGKEFAAPGAQVVRADLDGRVTRRTREARSSRDRLTRTAHPVPSNMLLTNVGGQL